MIGEIQLSNKLPQKVKIIKGFYQEEWDNINKFRWMRKKALIYVSKFNKDDWLLFKIKSPSESVEVLRIYAGTNAKFVIEIHIIPGEWKVAGIPINMLKKCKYIQLVADYKLQNIQDRRELSFMLSEIHVGKPSVFEENSALMHIEVFNSITPKSYGTLLACDTSSKCNLRCLHCVLDKELRKNHPNPAKGLEKIKELTFSLIPYATKIQPYLTGEPFVRKDIWDIIDRVNEDNDKRNIEIEVSTNGLLLKGALAERILMSPITSLLVTVNAGKPETYKRLMGASLETLSENIKNIMRSPLRKPSLIVSLSFVIMRENIEELPEFIKLAYKVGVKDVQIWSLNNVAEDINDKERADGFVFNYKQQMPKYYPKLTKIMIEQAKEIANKLGIRIGVIPSYRFDDVNIEDVQYPIGAEEFNVVTESMDNIMVVSNNNKKIRNCYFPWNSIYYTTEGDFAPCLHLVYKGGIANILERSLQEVWNGIEMQKLRLSIIKGVVPQCCADTQCPFVGLEV
jgi:MoaA/NifB/PqqE/SkfB family radical SAM enzyme